MLASIVFILLLSSLASYAIATYKFKCNTLLTIYFLIGIIVPIRLGTVGVLKIMTGLNLTNTLWALVLMYTVAGIPQTLFILTQFYKQIHPSIREAAKIDGANEYRVYLLSTKLVKPALAATAILCLSPIWNDIWWPLILASGRNVMTVTLGAQQFLGQFSTNWNALLSALTVAILPLVILFLVFSKYVISGLLDGAVKG
jgi:raffinose/stachyose/melibiose transport system permease protein